MEKVYFFNLKWKLILAFILTMTMGQIYAQDNVVKGHIQNS